MSALNVCVQVVLEEMDDMCKCHHIEVHSMIGASLSEPHTSGTALQDACVGLLVAIFPEN